MLGHALLNIFVFFIVKVVPHMWFGESKQMALKKKQLLVVLKPLFFLHCGSNMYHITMVIHCTDPTP